MTASPDPKSDGGTYTVQAPKKVKKSSRPLIVPLLYAVALFTAIGGGSEFLYGTSHQSERDAQRGIALIVAALPLYGFGKAIALLADIREGIRK
jgi:hypothetical protein